MAGRGGPLLAVVLAFIGASLLNGCGHDSHGGGGDHGHTDCLDAQAQCSKCLDYTCQSCNAGYSLVNGNITQGSTQGHGFCVATCIGQSPPPRPSRPSSPLDLMGKEWPMMCVNKSAAHFFGIGDWGGDGPGGETWTNPDVCPKRRECQETDKKAQQLVARQMKMLAPKSNPDYLLNVGDNFYPGGYSSTCGKPKPGQDPTGQFAQIFSSIYTGVGLDDKEWMSVLGNHDYGGYAFMAGWDEQILHTWDSKVWVMPAQTWRRRVQYRDFAVEYFFIDSNNQDARDDPKHCICQGKDEDECYGMTKATCPDMLDHAFNTGLQMVEEVLENSTAEWHILVTHFPGPSITGNPKVKELHQKYGIDFVVTGHEHVQQLGKSEDGIRYVITGGGGGVTSDALPSADGHDEAYGFVDFTISRTSLKVDMYSWGGPTGSVGIVDSGTINSHKAKKSESHSETVWT